MALTTGSRKSLVDDDDASFASARLIIAGIVTKHRCDACHSAHEGRIQPTLGVMTASPGRLCLCLCLRLVAFVTVAARPSNRRVSLSCKSPAAITILTATYFMVFQSLGSQVVE